MAATWLIRLFLYNRGFRRITEVQRCRGVRFQEEMAERVRKWAPVVGYF